MKRTIVFVFTSCKRSGPVQIMYNLIAHLNSEIFKPILITLYDECDGESDLEKFISLGVEHKKVALGKKEILLGKTKKLKQAILKFHPSIVHSMGVFPDYAVSKMGLNNQVITLHNYMHDDYLAKFGFLKGTMLEIMQKSAVRRATKVWTCSESLAKIYVNKEGRQFDFIRNGVDVQRYTKAKDKSEKNSLREVLKLSKDSVIFVYTGQFIDRKDQGFLLDVFDTEEKLREYILLLLGSGINFEPLKEKYSHNKNFIFTGNVPNVEEYLMASDFYISCSHSEGMPTSVLEAMSAGLPVILSDILQHKEIIDINNQIGFTYKLNDKADCVSAIEKIVSSDYFDMSNSAYDVAHNELSAETMSKKYQAEYEQIIKQNEEK